MCPSDESGMCIHCHNARLVGWSGAGPILCPGCSHGRDPFAVITQAWREQRLLAEELKCRLDESQIELSRLNKMLDICSDVHAHNVKLKEENARLRINSINARTT